METHPVGFELFHAGRRTDGQVEEHMMTVIVSFAISRKRIKRKRKTKTRKRMEQKYKSSDTVSIF